MNFFNNRSLGSVKKKKVTYFLRIIILLLPLLTFINNFRELINSFSNFIITITLIVLIYILHEFHFSQATGNKDQVSFKVRKCMEQSRKITVCFFSSILTSILLIEVADITINIYKVYYGEEIIYWFTIVVTLSNLQANIELCQKDHRSKVKSEKQNKRAIDENNYRQELIKAQIQPEGSISRIQKRKQRMRDSQFQTQKLLKF